jgi:hypothetical protein
MRRTQQPKLPTLNLDSATEKTIQRFAHLDGTFMRVAQTFWARMHEPNARQSRNFIRRGFPFLTMSSDGCIANAPPDLAQQSGFLLSSELERPREAARCLFVPTDTFEQYFVCAEFERTPFNASRFVQVQYRPLPLYRIHRPIVVVRKEHGVPIRDVARIDDGLVRSLSHEGYVHITPHTRHRLLYTQEGNFYFEFLIRRNV